MTGAYLFLIKAVQWLMLLAALAAFGYGASQLGSALWLRAVGTRAVGTVIDEGRFSQARRTVSSVRINAPFEKVVLLRPVVEYTWPPGSDTRLRATAPVAIEPADAERFARGSHVELRVDPDHPARALVVVPLAAYFWPIVAFLAGAAALALLTSLFYLHEAAFGRDLSAGVSLFRSVRAAHLLVAASAIAIVYAGVRYTLPWLGVRELAALATGEIRLLPGLLQARGAPAPGQPLNEAEAAVARLPALGEAYASTALERAIAAQRTDDIRRFLDAYADPAVEFPARSRRALFEAVAHRDLATFRRLLELGFRPEDSLLDPRLAAQRAGLPAFIEALDAAARRAGRSAK